MTVSSCPRVFPTFECRSDPDYAGTTRPDHPSSARFATVGKSPLGGLSSLILRFPPNFARQLSTKARRNCGNIGVAQVVAASWSATPPPPSMLLRSRSGVNTVADLSYAGERLGRGIVTDSITTPVVDTSAYFFKKTSELIDFKEGRHSSFEYGRYGNPTTVVAEEKISALEGAESTLLLASGMCASTVMLLALVPAGGHIVTTTDCYRKTRIFIETILPKMGIKATVIDPADVHALESALYKNQVTLFFTETPTNPFLRCVDIELVSKLCHSKGALVCVDGTFATPLNQKALALGADMVLHSATKYIAGHNDVSMLVSLLVASVVLRSFFASVRMLHNVFGGALNPNAAYLIIRGMKTLHLRIEQQNTTALKMARLLEAHTKVSRVYYPGLASHPEHYLARRQMTGFGGVVSFEINGDLMITAKFIDALKIPYIASSFGGCESIVDQPAIMSYWDLSQLERAKFGIKDNLVRFSFGVEDMKADILQALEAI
ncbi:hypothetical protein RJ639_040198 [Escallonia herrerae]|uniref:plant cystathionine gamma-synthase n=1 Tax=Escallonia herrerae TaxID=1293975 RepID=A0AA88WKX7_9ASTE|nr:hypothetical protein RJ639_040198 [Escallonia herrerae]